MYRSPVGERGAYSLPCPPGANQIKIHQSEFLLVQRGGNKAAVAHSSEAIQEKTFVFFLLPHSLPLRQAQGFGSVQAFSFRVAVLVQHGVNKATINTTVKPLPENTFAFCMNAF